MTFFFHNYLAVPMEGPEKTPSLDNPEGARPPLARSFHVRVRPFLVGLDAQPWIPSGEDGLFLGVANSRMRMRAIQHPPKFEE